MLGILLLVPGQCLARVTNAVVDTGQKDCYDNNRRISCPRPGDPFWGQDGNYIINAQSYRDNGDGTITDIVTGLMWSKGAGETKLSLSEAERQAKEMTLGGHHDWRVPNIKELYSLINFSGNTGTRQGGDYSEVPANAIPFINTDYFDFRYGDPNRGERYIDAQWLSSTRYVSTTMNGNPTLFGVNFADGRIKGYPDGVKRGLKEEKKYYVRYVRGAAYGVNRFVDNGDGTVTDEATGLMWLRGDSKRPMNWQQALAYAENSTYAGYGDWRLPDAKELQFIVDYSRSPDTSDSAAIDPLFEATSIVNEAGEKDYGYYWTSTSHQDGKISAAAYICFGRAIGVLHGRIMDVHGAGAQRSDPKTGRSFLGHGPQGDAVRVKNYVRLVRGGMVATRVGTTSNSQGRYPNKVRLLDNTSPATRSRHAGSPQGPSPSADQKSPPGDGFPNTPPPRSRSAGQADFIKRLDRDGDNRVSPSEFDGPARHFADFDTNGDGYISLDEAPSGPPPLKRP